MSNTSENNACFVCKLEQIIGSRKMWRSNVKYRFYHRNYRFLQTLVIMPSVRDLSMAFIPLITIKDFHETASWFIYHEKRYPHIQLIAMIEYSLLVNRNIVQL